MLNDKELKQNYGKLFSKEPKKYYPTEFLESSGFSRRACKSCGRAFWSVDTRDVCGDSACEGRYTFLGKRRNSLGYKGVWESFSSYMGGRGYAPIKRYPVAARWRDDIHFVEASIDDFIPYVVNGVVRPPKNPLTVPQFCLRFTDIENVGVTGAHYTGFVMIGQHAFVQKQDYDPDKYLNDLYSWFLDEVKLTKSETVFHEDVWAGSGNFGPCMEIFSGGLELANQVYMQFKQTDSGYRDLKLKVLDMGMGQERVAWFSSGKGLAYESTFPKVVSRLRKETGMVVDDDIIKRFLPYAGNLNADEVDLDKAWTRVADKVGVDVHTLKEEVGALSSIYAVADHTRSLLVALSDGALPSNSGGGYNLRVILRRSLDIMRKYGWDIDLNNVISWHVKEMKKTYPMVKEMQKEVEEIIDVEQERYERSRKRMRNILKGRESLDHGEMVELYDSQGISPEMFRKAGFEVPANFYDLVAKRHEGETREREAPEKEYELPATELLYLDDYKRTEFTAKVLKVDGDKVILDRTAFYATAGGQKHDTGEVGGQEVFDVYRAGDVVVHVIKNPEMEEGEEVKGRVHWPRRKQLAQHHTAVHIVNGAARQVLGNHVWQAGADKTIEKARLDITHYDSLTQEQVDEIEKVANKVVKKGLDVESKVMAKDVAEKRFGFRVYQGGFVPGGSLRIVKINNFDIEACGGTHLNNTKEAGMIKIIGSSKVQEGVVRIEMKAGNAVMGYATELEEIANEACKLIGCKIKDLPSRCRDLFREWKKARKGKEAEFKTGDYKEVRAKGFKGIKMVESCLDQAGGELKVQKKHIPKTIKRFMNDIKSGSK